MSQAEQALKDLFTHEEVKQAISRVLQAIVEREPEYYLYGEVIRWGRVERKLHRIVDAFQPDSATVNERACALALRYGGIDGGHHKQWLIDQMLRIVAGDDYDRIVEQYNSDPCAQWNTGIAP